MEVPVKIILVFHTSVVYNCLLCLFDGWMAKLSLLFIFHQRIGLQVRNFEDFIYSLNNQNYLLKKGPKLYQLQTASCLWLPTHITSCLVSTLIQTSTITDSQNECNIGSRLQCHVHEFCLWEIHFALISTFWGGVIFFANLSVTNTAIILLQAFTNFNLLRAPCTYMYTIIVQCGK